MNKSHQYKTLFGVGVGASALVAAVTVMPGYAHAANGKSNHDTHNQSSRQPSHPSTAKKDQPEPKNPPRPVTAPPPHQEVTITKPVSVVLSQLAQPVLPQPAAAPRQIPAQAAPGAASVRRSTVGPSGPSSRTSETSVYADPVASVLTGRGDAFLLNPGKTPTTSKSAPAGFPNFIHLPSLAQYEYRTGGLSQPLTRGLYGLVAVLVVAGLGLQTSRRPRVFDMRRVARVTGFAR